MSHKFDSPVQTQMAVAVFSDSCNAEYNRNLVEKPSGRRRVFIQTETGCVLGMELDRNDNAHTVKRRMQLALNVPTEESSLTFGDLTLNNDLSAVPSDSPLLLTRNGLHRSSSTPCLSPTVRMLQQRDQSGTIEILGHSSRFAKAKEVVEDIVKAIKNGVDPIPIHSGLGGAYFFRNSKGENAAIVKPTDEEPFAPNNPKGFVGKALGHPGLKPSVRVGETGFREVAAYLLDYDHFANVPPTVLIKITHSVFNVNDSVNGNKFQNREKVSKIASLQQFISHDYDASDYGTSSFPVGAIHRIGILDIRIFNTDRHAGNLLVRKLDGLGRLGQVELIPIDHGLCLPENLEDPYFEWIHWPQASIPFSEDELEYIKKLDPFQDSEMLQNELPMIREACLRVLVLCTIFLQEAAAFGLCLAEIGEMMSREFHGQEEEPSELEVICLEAKRIIAEREITFPEIDEGHEEFQFDIDCEDLEIKGSSHENSSSRANGLSLLSKLHEEPEDNEIEAAKLPTKAEKRIMKPTGNWFETASRLFLPSKKVNLAERNQQYFGKAESKYTVGSSPINRRSANEKLPTTTNFVKVADMTEQEWIIFIEQFKELLSPAFVKRREATMGQRQRQRQRLGTSCQF